MTPRPRPEIMALPTYGTGRPQRNLKYRLSSNESPFEPGPAVVEAVVAATRLGNRYPPLNPTELIAALATRHRVEDEQILLSGGSVAVLEQLVRAFAGPGDQVVYPWRSYEAYPIVVGAAGAEPVEVPLAKDHVDVDAMVHSITPATRVVVLCNPNNPTSTVLAPGVLGRFLDRIAAEHPGQDLLVIHDEAYREFVTPGTSDDGIALGGGRPQLAVLRTFSKAYGLAGLRIGYCVADRNVVDAARRVALPFTLSAPALAAGMAALRDPGRMAAQVAELMIERDWLRGELRALGLPCPRSGANFLWLPLGTESGSFAQACADSGIGVRLFPAEGVRITVGERDSSDAVLSAIHTWNPK